MSAEATKTEETAPVVPKPEQSTETPTAAETTEAPASTTPAADASAPTTEESKKGETVPASEGVLGYKAPGFLKQFHFSKHHFWFSDEPVPAESLSHIREKHGNEHAAWARETGKGALFFSKRAEDKGTPSGMILLHEASNVAKEGLDSFSVKVGNHIHRFETATFRERDAWIAALEKKLEEAKALKDEITGRESYKKNMEEYAKPAVASTGAAAAVKKERSKSKEAKKSVDATNATEAKTGETPAPVEEKKTEKERSQSRKRSSIFGSLLSKKDEQKTEEKKEEKAVKEEKKAEAEQKKEEAKETHEPSKAVEAAEATAAAAVPAAVASDKKKEDKEEEKAGATTPTDKKAKRGSVFGSLFSKKNVTSPSAEKTEADATTPAKDSDVPPVSETAPKLDEPIDTKPIDAAAVTAPATTEDAAKETTTTPAAESSPKTEKKGNFLTGLIKKVEGKKEESKEEKPAETTTADATAPATTETNGTAETPATKDERPNPQKRRTSLFGGLGTIRKKSDKKEESAEPSEEVNGTETKREKSPLPGKLGGLFRKPSKAVKSDAPKETTATETATDATPAVTEPKDAPVTEEPKPAAAPETTDSKIVGDVVPDDMHAPTADKVATAPEVKASA